MVVVSARRSADALGGEMGVGQVGLRSLVWCRTLIALRWLPRHREDEVEDSVSLYADGWVAEQDIL
jgi:hypothetical protein